MSKISNYSEGAAVNHLLRNTAYTYTAPYISLHTGDPGETGANELSGGGYQRVEVTAWNAAASRAITNTNIIQFNIMLAAVGTITHVGAWDAQSGGNLLWGSSALSSSLATSLGSAPRIAASGLSISMGGAISTYAANAFLNLVFDGDAFATPGTSLYISLHTGAVGLTGANEVSGNAYARVQEPTWDAPSNGATANTAETSMGTPTPSSWGTITDCGIFDALSAGNFLIGGALASPGATEAGQEVVFESGALDVTVA